MPSPLFQLHPWRPPIRAGEDGSLGRGKAVSRTGSIKRQPTSGSRCPGSVDTLSYQTATLPVTRSESAHIPKPSLSTPSAVFLTTQPLHNFELRRTDGIAYKLATVDSVLNELVRLLGDTSGTIPLSPPIPAPFISSAGALRHTVA